MNKKRVGNHATDSRAKENSGNNIKPHISLRENWSHKMDIFINLFVTLSGVLGIIAATLALVHYRDAAILTGCVAVNFAVIAFFAGIQDKAWKMDKLKNEAISTSKPEPKIMSEQPIINNISSVNQSGGFTGTVNVTQEIKDKPRSLDLNQRATFIKALEGMPRGVIELASLIGDNESQKFSQELASAFTEAGYNVNVGRHSMGGAPPNGIVITVHSQEAPPEHLTGIWRAFVSIKITPECIVAKDIKPEVVTIDVYGKP